MTEKPFDPNLGHRDNGALLPSAESMAAIGGPAPLTEEAYAKGFSSVVMGGSAPEPNSTKSWLGTFGAAIGDKVQAIAKATLPPSMFSFLRMTYMPDPANEGILQWPGIAPEALGKVVRENIAPQLVIGMRCDDVMRYSTQSDHPWKPGWRIESMDTTKNMPDEHLEHVKDAEKFLNNSCMDYDYNEARLRDQNHLTDFQHFLAALVRDSLTYDGIGLWTDMTVGGKVKKFALLPAAQIRLAGPGGYRANPKHFAVAVDEQNKIIHIFTRDELTFYIRNPRTDIGALGYGLSETELGIRLVQGFQNAIDLNIDTFNRNATPNGIMVVTGMSQRQLDVLNRMWSNLKKGITKQWALPVVGLPDKESKLEIIDMSAIKGMEAYYQDTMNLMVGAFCVLYRFPVRRIGYRISGNKTPTEPTPDSGAKLVDEDDPGLAPLLTHIENLINQYLIWTNWPHLRFAFSGKDPKEDARGYEFKKNAMTWEEARREANLPDLLKGLKGAAKKFMEIMRFCPLDPNLSGSFQSLASAVLSDGEEGGEKGNSMSGKKDPAASEDHGHRSGVRRDSAAESGGE